MVYWPLAGNDSTRYVMLIASLPVHGRLFTQNQTPLSRARLERRLKLMTPDDRALLGDVERVVRWDALPGAAGDADMIRRAKDLLARLSADGLTTLETAVQNRLELRTVVAALRRRHVGLDPPESETTLGVGRWNRRILRNWDVRDFGLSIPFPWIGEAVDLLETDDPLNLEKLLLGRAWLDLRRLAAGHDFDLTGVVLYVLRWDIVDRWTRRGAEAAQARYDALLADGLEDHDTLFDASEAA